MLRSKTSRKEEALDAQPVEPVAISEGQGDPEKATHLAELASPLIRKRKKCRPLVPAENASGVRRTVARPEIVHLSFAFLRPRENGALSVTSKF